MDRSRPQPLFDDVDRAIIDCLREDGRMPSSTIAQRVGVSEKTVRRRLQQLSEERGLKLAPVIDPDLIGLSTCLYVGLSVESSRMEEVAARVRLMPEVRYLAHTTGPWDLLAEAFVGSREHMADFIIKSIGQLPGVTKTETFNVIRIAKFGYEWEIPRVIAAPQPPVSIAHPQYTSSRTNRNAPPNYRAG